MIRLAIFSILFCLFVASQLVVQGQAAMVPGIAPIVPTRFPFPPAINPNILGFNNPFNQYNVAAVPILSYSSEHTADGTYAFSFSTADGKQAQENGFLKGAYIDHSGEPQGTQVVQGNYAYISPEGVPIQVSYVADENGFRPSSVHIPANGKTALPQIGNIKEKQIFGAYNRHNPYNYRNRLFGQYNNPIYNPNDPYDHSMYNPYLGPGINNVVRNEAKKGTA